MVVVQPLLVRYLESTADNLLVQIICPVSQHFKAFVLEIFNQVMSTEPQRVVERCTGHCLRILDGRRWLSGDRSFLAAS